MLTVSCALRSSPHALDRLIDELNKATSSIDVAMFTFTHPDLCDALVKARERGVSVTVTLDTQVARGASKKVCRALKEAGVCVRISKGLQLFHYKWAYIDRSTLVIGSANWTKAAFTKNQDYFLIQSNVSAKNHAIMKTIKAKIAHYSHSS